MSPPRGAEFDADREFGFGAEIVAVDVVDETVPVAIVGGEAEEAKPAESSTRDVEADRVGVGDGDGYYFTVLVTVHSGEGLGGCLPKVSTLGRLDTTQRSRWSRVAIE